MFLTVPSRLGNVTLSMELQGHVHIIKGTATAAQHAEAAW